MSKLELSVATTDYDHFRDFRFGLVEAEGIKTHWMTLGHHEIFARYTFNREFDVRAVSCLIESEGIPESVLFLFKQRAGKGGWRAW